VPCRAVPCRVLRENKRPPEGGLCNRNRGLARRQLRSYERLTLIPHSALHYSLKEG
jgi:hypothetical protein